MTRSCHLRRPAFRRIRRPALLRLAATSVALLATGVWLGGIVVLGAIVAPTVFGIVPAPTSADAMTVVFVSFDKIAMSAAAIVAVAEVIRIRVAGSADRRDGANVGVASAEREAAKSPAWSPAKIDVARLAVIGAAGALAILQGLWLSPTIVALHREGAIRGSGELGGRLERFHSWSETCGKTESLLLVALVVLLAHGVAASAADRRNGANVSAATSTRNT